MILTMVKVLEQKLEDSRLSILRHHALIFPIVSVFSFSLTHSRTAPPKLKQSRNSCESTESKQATRHFDQGSYASISALVLVYWLNDSMAFVCEFQNLIVIQN